MHICARPREIRPAAQDMDATGAWVAVLTFRPAAQDTDRAWSTRNRQKVAARQRGARDRPDNTKLNAREARNPSGQATRGARPLKKITKLLKEGIKI